MGTWKNTVDHFGPGARILHWVMAILVLVQLAIGFAAWEFLDRSPFRTALVFTHFSLGMTLLALVVARIAWRLSNPPPRPLAGVPSLLVKGAAIAHGALYLLMLAVPLSGWLIISSGSGSGPMVFDLIRLPAIWAESKPVWEFAKALHVWLAWALSALVVAHIGFALYHLLIRKDGVFRRMVG